MFEEIKKKEVFKRGRTKDVGLREERLLALIIRQYISVLKRDKWEGESADEEGLQVSSFTSKYL